MTDTITITAYRSDGIDTCRGCVMSSTSSEFEMEAFEEVKDAAKFIARFVHENKHNDTRGLCEWQIVVLVNGKPASYNDFCNQLELSEPEEGLYNLFKGYTEEAIGRLEHERALKIEKEQVAIKRAQTHAEASAKKKRFELLQVLKQEFNA